MNTPAKAGTLKSNTESGKGRERRGTRGKLFSWIKAQRGTGWGGLEMPLEHGGMDGGHRDWDGDGAAEPFPGTLLHIKFHLKSSLGYFKHPGPFVFQSIHQEQIPPGVPTGIIT